MLDDAPSTSNIWSLTKILTSARLARKAVIQTKHPPGHDSVRVKGETLQQQRSGNSTTSCAPEFRSLYQKPAARSRQTGSGKVVPLHVTKGDRGVTVQLHVILNIRRR